MPITLGLTFTFCTAILVIFGDYLIKIAADRGHGVMSGLVMSGCILYAVSALMWFYALHHVTLSQAGVAYSMLTLLALCGIGVAYFGEVLYPRELFGIGFALLSMLLMMRVA
ncbi:EamA family transporter [Sulfitobacter sp. JB4-11]|uniref:EamA family transporter n=1 Tax=Sulfitobacter rhodophyticola TaxID=3238304 RepID=UPI00351937F8